jgi:hypothetical protein
VQHVKLYQAMWVTFNNLSQVTCDSQREGLLGNLEAEGKGGVKIEGRGTEQRSEEAKVSSHFSL